MDQDDDFKGGTWWFDGRILLWSERQVALDLKLIKSIDETDELETLNRLRQYILNLTERLLIVVEHILDSNMLNLVQSRWCDWIKGKNIVCAILTDKPELKNNVAKAEVVEFPTSSNNNPTFQLYHLANDPFDEPGDYVADECEKELALLSSSEREALDQLANHLRRAPIAIELVAKLMRKQKNSSWEVMLKEWFDHAKKYNDESTLNDLRERERIEFLSVMMSASKLTESAKSVMKLISLWGDECDFIPRSWVGGAPTTFVELEKYSILFSERTPDIVCVTPTIARFFWRSLTETERVSMEY